MATAGDRITGPDGDSPSDFAEPGRETAEQAASPPTKDVAEHRSQSILYEPSWIDRLTDWVSRLPIPAWVFYPVLGLALALLLSSVAWAGRVDDPVMFLVNYLLEAMTLVFILALIHYLDHSAAAALARFRRVLAVDDAAYKELNYQLTTLPAWPTLLAWSLGAIYAIASLLANVVTYENRNGISLVVSLPVIVMDVGFRILIYVLVGVLIYHTLHQLRMVNEIYTRHTRINLFQLGPLYSLSSLTALTAIGIGIPTYLWFQINILSADSSYLSDIFQTIVLGIVIVVTFISPLLGAHSLLEKEKQRLNDEVARRMEATIARLHKQIDNDVLDDRAALKETLDGLVTEQGVIQKLRTWPWRTETVGGLGLAFLLPILIWVVQRVLERLGF